MADFTQRFIDLGQTRDEERATKEANHAGASSRANDLAMRLV